MYKIIRLEERPFVLHIFIAESDEFILKKMNAQKKKLKLFEVEFFKMEKATVAQAYDLVDYLPGHFSITITKPPGDNIADIVHEVGHIVFRHFRWIGQNLDESSEESYCYMLDYLSSKIYKMSINHFKI